MTAQDTAAKKPAAAKPPTAQRAPDRKVLRIGIIHGGRIVEERLIPLGEAVSVGEHERCTVVLPATAKLPAKKFELFSPRGEQYDLQFTDDMHGKVSLADQVVTLASLAQKGQAKKVKGNTYRLALDEKVRGKVYVGEHTFLFQFVTAPPRPKGRGGVDFRAWRWEDVDWMFLGFLMSSALLHTAFIIWTESQPPPKKVTLEDFPDRIVKIIIPQKKEEPPPPPTAEKPTEAKEEAPVEEAPKEEAPKEEAPPAEAATPTPETAEQKQARLEQAAATKGLLAVLGTRGKGQGAAQDLINNAAGMSAQAAESLKASSSAGVGSGDADGSGLRGGGGGEGAAGIGGVGGAGGGSGGDVSSTKVQKELVAKVSTENVPINSKDAAGIQGVIKRSMGQIKACYERELKTNPDLAGKVSVSWVISPEGKAQEVSVVENTMGNNEVGNCVAKVIGRIPFPAPPDGAEVEIPGYPFVFAAQ
jgi:outer membrane biosynthesis protein TonB